MNAIKPILPLMLALLIRCDVEAQGFVNLNFEAANVSGYTPGIANVPVTSALPGWNAFFSNSSTTNSLTHISYDGISLGGAVISVIDSQAPSFTSLQGNYSAFLFGGPYQSPALFSAGISQTGLVPTGTKALLFDAYNAAAPFVVSLGGQVINVIPLQTFSNYTLYGGDISSFAGQVDTLSFIEPPALFGSPSFFELDNIQFSRTAIVPEPGVFDLTALGGLLLALRRWRNFPR